MATMATQAARPRGRRPGHEDTRGAIARSALGLFDEHGYDGASLRAIAREAGVDPALVHHYFDTKARLFTTVWLDAELDLASHLEPLLAGDRATLGRRLAQGFFDLWEHPRYRGRLTLFLSDAPGSPRRRRLLGEFLAREVFGRVASTLGHSNGMLRGQLASSTMLGVMAGRHLLELGALSTASPRSLVGPVGRALQHYLVEPW